MPKKPPPPPPPSSSRATLALLAIGGLIVAGLVVWALTRTVERPAPVATTDTMATTAPVTSATNATTTSTSALPVSVAPPAEESNASIPRIAVEDLREQMKAGQVTVIDVRPAASYQTSHIEGAMNIPLASIETEMSSLSKKKPIVTYCT